MKYPEKIDERKYIKPIRIDPSEWNNVYNAREKVKKDYRRRKIGSIKSSLDVVVR